jgi:hypothetical protein
VVLTGAGQGSTLTSTNHRILQCVMDMGELVLVWLILVPISSRDLKTTVLISTTETFEQIDASLVYQKTSLSINETI